MKRAMQPSSWSSNDSLPPSGDDDASLRLEEISDGASRRSAAATTAQERPEAEEDPIVVLGQSMLRLFLPLGMGDRRVRVMDGDEEDDNDEGDWRAAAEARLGAILARVVQMRSDHDGRVRGLVMEVEGLRGENEMLRERLRATVEGGEDDGNAKARDASVPVPGDPSDPSYALELQTRLAEALRNVEKLSRQVEVIQSEADERARSLRARLIEQENESYRSEVEHMNDLLAMEREVERLRAEREDDENAKLTSVAELEFQLEMERSLRMDALSFSKGGRGGGGEGRRDGSGASGGGDGPVVECGACVVEGGDVGPRRRMSKRLSTTSEATCPISNISKELGTECSIPTKELELDGPPIELFAKGLFSSEDLNWESKDLTAAETDLVTEWDDVQEELREKSKQIESLQAELEERNRAIAEISGSGREGSIAGY